MSRLPEPQIVAINVINNDKDTVKENRSNFFRVLSEMIHDIDTMEQKEVRKGK